MLIVQDLCLALSRVLGIVLCAWHCVVCLASCVGPLLGISRLIALHIVLIVDVVILFSSDD